MVSAAELEPLGEVKALIARVRQMCAEELLDSNWWTKSTEPRSGIAIVKGCRTSETTRFPRHPQGRPDVVLPWETTATSSPARFTQPTQRISLSTNATAPAKGEVRCPAQLVGSSHEDGTGTR